MANDPILDNLNPQQLAAVTAGEGPLLIVAGAGTGKTRVITRRLAFLVREKGIRPYQVFAATFTNKAADEMKKRVAELTANLCTPDFHISTFHSLCARILRREASTIGLSPGFTICDERDQTSAIKSVIKRLGMDDKQIKPGDVQNVINQCKIRMLGPEDVSQVTASKLEGKYAEAYAEYEKYLRENSAVDFEDLILLTVKMFKEYPDVLENYQQRYRHVVVDEYQDTNAVQVELVRLLAGEHRNLAVVGDEDQSIYSWRGADIGNLLSFQKHFPDVLILRLEQNYRSTGNILKAAADVIRRNKERLGKELFTTDSSGDPLYAVGADSEMEESLFVAKTIQRFTQSGHYKFSDIAVFYRVSALSRSIEDRMREYKFPYRVVGGIKFYERSEIKDLISYLNVVQNTGNSMALLRIINSPRRGIGDKSLQGLIDYSRRNRICEFETMGRCTTEEIVPRGAAGKIATLHKQIRTWVDFAAKNPVSELLKRILEDTDYIAALGDPKSLEVQSRTENIQELVSSIINFESERPTARLQDYLENVSLVSPTDDLPNQSAVSLMTLHAAKGLEYKLVFMIGLEEGIFPSMRTVMESGTLEEERRLFYVGMTRAREILVLTRAQRRVWYGELRYNPPSSFLKEVPRDVLRNASIEVLPGEEDPNEPFALEEPRLRRAPVPAMNRAQNELDSQRTSVRGIALGTRVRHAVLGEGVVTGIKGYGDSVSYLLQLEDGDTLQILARHAKLEVIK